MASARKLADKIYYRIGEVSQATGLPAYVLRFWETEFPRIKPKRTASGQRLYQKKDIDHILVIKKLLYERKFTIKGAKQHLRSQRRARAETGKPHSSLVEEIRYELEKIRDLLS
jgi:DNA-binding transcriptional MerR regulator